MEPNTTVYWVVIAALVGLIFLAKRFLKNKRTAARRELAGARNLTLRADAPDDLERFEQFTAFDALTIVGRRTAGKKYAANTMTGSIEIGNRSYDLQAGDYRTHRKAAWTPYALVRLPCDGVPKLIIRDEEITDKLRKEIKFEGDATSHEFDRRFFVRGDDEATARELLQPEVMRLLLAQEHLQWVEIHQDTICLKEHGARDIYELIAEIRRPNDGMARLLGLMDEILAVLPDRLTRGP